MESNGTFPEQRVRIVLWDTFPPFIIIIGVVFNGLSLIVLNRRPLRKLNVSSSLSVLSVVDTCVLCTGLLRHWLKKASYVGVDIQDLSRIGCKLNEFLVYFTLGFSAWIVMAVALERYLTVCVSTSNAFRNWITTRRGLSVMLTMFCVWCFLVNSHFFYTRDLLRGNDCTDVPSAVHFKHTIWTWFDFTQTAIIPFSVIVFCNASILIKICQVSAASTIVSTSNRRNSRNSRVTTMLLLVSFTFLLCAFPVKLYLICIPGRGKMPPNVERYSHEYYRYRLGWTIVLLFQYTNNAINFFLYCASNAMFRRELRVLFCGEEVADVGCMSRNETRLVRSSDKRGDYHQGEITGSPTPV